MRAIAAPSVRDRPQDIEDMVGEQAVLDRLEELLPSAVAGLVTGSLEDLYMAVVGVYLEAVA
jgi:hypothetical protein